MITNLPKIEDSMNDLRGLIINKIIRKIDIVHTF